MSEILNTFLLEDPETPIPMDRDQFYSEQIAAYQKTGKPTRACEIVDVFIFNSDKELLVQKRSAHKKHNPGLLDKSIGGHVRYGDTPDYTVMVETVQELQTPSIVLKNKVDFKKTFELLTDYLTTVAVIRHGSSDIILLEKKIDGKPVIIANKIHVYFGIYDGRTKTVDKEAQGLLSYKLADLDAEMKSNPALFTDDMHVLMHKLRPDINEFLKFFEEAA
jgi:isopentenyldiphosphate isomerase